MSETHQLHQSPYRAHTYRVFLSSTSKDLKDHRALVTKTLLRLDQFPDDMAYFGAWGDGDAALVSLAEVASADIYILLVAWRYGTILPNETQSITHLEYLEALRQRQKRAFPIFVFLADDSTRNFLSDPNALFPASVRDPEHWDQLIAFRAEVGERHVCDMFTTPDDLGLQVATALNRELLHRQYDELTRTPRVPYYLPPLPPGFVGRERELDDLCARLRAGRSVGLSAAVAGMAGVGKSALAAMALRRLATETPTSFPGGIAWVSCNGRTGTTGLAWVYDQLLHTWGTPLSREEVAQAEEAEDPALLREHAVQRRFAPNERSGGNGRDAGSDAGTAQAPKLVLLDNSEEALPLARALATLGSAGITALVTTRHRPTLPALSLLALDTLEHEPEQAVILFAERYTQAGGQWDATRDTAAAQQVVALLGYLPLAIELEAARTVRDALSVAALAAEAREADRLGRLRDPLDPTRSVRYAFERSVATLTDEEHYCFTALGMLAVPDAPRSLVLDLCTYLPLQTEQDEEPQEESEDEDERRHWEQMAAACLAALSARSLIAQVSDAAPEDEGAAGVRARVGRAGAPDPAQTSADADRRSMQVARRVRVHPLLHEFAQAAWSEAPVEQRTADMTALLSASIRYSEITSTGGAGGVGGATRGRFAALERDETLLVSALRLAQQVLEHPWDEGTDVTVDAPGEAADPVAEAHAILMSLSIRLVDALNEYITLGGHWRLGVELLLYQLRLRREVGDRGGEGATLSRLGGVADDLGRKQEALDYFQQALVIAREVGDRRGEGVTLNNLGLLANSLSYLQEALDYFQQALVILREVGDRSGEGTTLNNLGSVADSLGRNQEALDYYQQALAIHQEVGNRAMEGMTLSNLGYLADTLGRNQEALDYYQQALAIFDNVGLPQESAVIRANIARVMESMESMQRMQREEAASTKQRTWRWPWQR